MTDTTMPTYTPHAIESGAYIVIAAWRGMTRPIIAAMTKRPMEFSTLADAELFCATQRSADERHGVGNRGH